MRLAGRGKAGRGFSPRPQISILPKSWLRTRRTGLDAVNIGGGRKQQLSPPSHRRHPNSHIQSKRADRGGRSRKDESDNFPGGVPSKSHQGSKSNSSSQSCRRPEWKLSAFPPFFNQSPMGARFEGGKREGALHVLKKKVLPPPPQGVGTWCSSRK